MIKLLLIIVLITFALAIGGTVYAQSRGVFARRKASRAGGFHGQAIRGGFHR